MVRKLALAVSIALGTLNVPAHALGLGELASKSRLNQNFNGDITLLSVTNEELDGIRVKLADAEAFQRAGAERPFYLSLLKFSPQLNEAGKPVIRVSSEFPIREPFLNFLVEVNWPNGRLLREYTVLLDPPTTTMRRPPQTAAPVARTRPAPPVAAPVRSAPLPAPTPRAAPAPGVRATAGEYGPVQASETAWSIAKKVRPSGVSMEQMMMALLSANPEAFIDNDINRLRQGRILRVPALDEIQQLTRQQARAMYREQQDQWLARRDARLQAAAAAEAPPSDTVPATETDDQLRIAAPRPDGEGDAGAGENDATAQTDDDLQSRLIVARENAETSRQEAEVLRSQVDDLQARLEDMQKLLSLKDDQLARLQDRLITDEAAEQTAPVSADAAADEPAVETPAEAVVSDTAVPSFVPPPGYQIPDVTPRVDVDAIVEVRLPPEDALDEVLADLERAAQETVAEAAETTEAPATGAPAVPDFVPPPGYQIPDVTPLVDVDAIVEGRVPVEVEPAEVTEAVEEPGEIVIEGLVDSAAEPALDQPPADEPAQVVEPGTDPIAQAPSEPATAESEAPAAPQILPPALATLVEENIVPLAGGGVALIGLIGWLATRRRKHDEAAPAAKPPVAEGADLPPVDQPAVTGETLNDLPDSAFLDEFSPGDISSLQDETGEVDPVSEADVYIAYGRYQQAQELLRQALERDPDRLALKHKLLEVFYATRDGDAFAALAQEMVDAGQDVADEAAWVRAQDMGRELQPANPLFAEKGGVGVATAAAGAAVAAAAVTSADADDSKSVDDDTLSLGDLDLSDLDEEYDATKAGEEPIDAPSEVSITLDLDEPSAPVDTADSELEMPDLPESISLDDLGSLELEDLEAPKPAEEAAAKDSETSEDSFDLDSMMAEAEAVVDGSSESTLNLDSEFSADELQAELDQLSDLSVLDSEFDKDQSPAGAEESPTPLGLVEEDLAAESEGLDQPIDLDAAFETAGEQDADSEVLDLDSPDTVESEDDVSTKLDLARAYVEMGDEDGARSILEEVVSEGTDSQKGEAEQLLSGLG